MKRGDFIVLGVIIALLILGSLRIFSRPAESVVVIAEGREIYRAGIHTDAQIQAGEGNVVLVRGGEAKMLRADCQDQICVQSAPISRRGQAIVCLPNGVSVRLESNGDEYDSISY